MKTKTRLLTLTLLLQLQTAVISFSITTITTTSFSSLSKKKEKKQPKAITPSSSSSLSKTLKLFCTNKNNNNNNNNKNYNDNDWYDDYDTFVDDFLQDMEKENNYDTLSKNDLMKKSLKIPSKKKKEENVVVNKVTEVEEEKIMVTARSDDNNNENENSSFDDNVVVDDDDDVSRKQKDDEILPSPPSPIVMELLEEREDARFHQDYDTADRIRLELIQEHNIFINDDDQTYTVGIPYTFQSSLLPQKEEKEQEDADEDGYVYINLFAPEVEEEKEEEIDEEELRWKELRLKEEKDFVSKNESTIYKLLIQREIARLQRHWRTADRIRKQLYTEYNVLIDDDEQTWTLREQQQPKEEDDEISAEEKRREQKRIRNLKERERKVQRTIYKQSRYSKSKIYSQEIMNTIIPNLITERIKHRIFRDFDKSDSIRQELKDKYDVIIDDDLQEWSIGGNFGRIKDDTVVVVPTKTTKPINKKYMFTKSEYSLELENEEQQLPIIDMFLIERNEYKKVRNFEKADAIRKELKKSYNIIINDKLKQWSVGGNFGSALQRTKYTKSKFSKDINSNNFDNTTTKEEDIETIIESLVTERIRNKISKNFRMADKIRNELKLKYDVIIDDELKEWSIGGDFGTFYTQSMYSNDIDNDDDDAIAIIESLLSKRYKYRKFRNFQKADEIRRELITKYNVIIDDKRKEWSVGGDFGE